MKQSKVNKNMQFLFYTISIVFLLLLSALNVKKISMLEHLVLGANTQEDANSLFWKEFLSRNPNYLPGWLEIGREDKVEEIDPNYNLN